MDGWTNATKAVLEELMADDGITLAALRPEDFETVAGRVREPIEELVGRELGRLKEENPAVAHAACVDELLRDFRRVEAWAGDVSFRWAGPGDIEWLIERETTAWSPWRHDKEEVMAKWPGFDGLIRRTERGTYESIDLDDDHLCVEEWATLTAAKAYINDECDLLTISSYDAAMSGDWNYFNHWYSAAAKDVVKLLGEEAALLTATPDVTAAAARKATAAGLEKTGSPKTFVRKAPMKA